MPHIHTFFIYAFWGWMGNFREEQILGTLDEDRDDEEGFRPTWVVRNGHELVGVRFIADGQIEVRLLYVGSRSSDGSHALRVVAETIRRFDPSYRVAEDHVSDQAAAK